MTGPFASQAEARRFMSLRERLSATILTQLLIDAKDAYTKYEAEYGTNEQWSEWYARYIIMRLDENK